MQRIVILNVLLLKETSNCFKQNTCRCNEDIYPQLYTVSIQIVNAIPYKIFNLMKNSGFIKNAMDRFININEIRFENFVQVW